MNKVRFRVRCPVMCTGRIGLSFCLGFTSDVMLRDRLRSRFSLKRRGH